MYISWVNKFSYALHLMSSIALDCDIPNELPYNDYFEYFGPDFKLHIQPSNMQNQNTQDYLDKIKVRTSCSSYN